MSPAQSTFIVLTDRVARLEVDRKDADPFGLTNFNNEQLHGLGFRHAPKYWLGEPYSPDDEWTLELRDAGTLPSERSEPIDWSSQYESWAAGTAAPHWHPLLGLLPQGRYYLVQPTMTPTASGKFLLGNNWMPARPNVLELLATTRSSSRRLGLGIDFSHSFHASIVGANVGRLPSFASPLLGLILLNPLAALTAQLVFFSFSSSDSDAADMDADPVLIVPVRGEMIIDCQRHFTDAARRTEDLRIWESKAVIQFMALCGVRTLDTEFVSLFGKPVSWAR